MSDFAKGLIVGLASDSFAFLKSIAPKAKICADYEHLAMPDYDKMRDLSGKYWDSTWINYGFDSVDFPLCKDFARLWSAKMLEAAIRENLPMRLACGQATYTRNDGQRHDIGFVVTAAGQIKYIEPQGGGWMDIPEDFKAFVFYSEINPLDMIDQNDGFEI